MRRPVTPRRGPFRARHPDFWGWVRVAVFHAALLVLGWSLAVHDFWDATECHFLKGWVCA